MAKESSHVFVIILLSMHNVGLFSCLVILVAHFVIPLLLRWYPSSTVMSLTYSVGDFVLSWVSYVPASIAFNVAVSVAAAVVVVAVVEMIGSALCY